MKETGLEEEDELRPEYDLAELLKGGVQGKYVEQYREGANLVLLTPDVAAAFPDSDAVNKALQMSRILVDESMGDKVTG